MTMSVLSILISSSALTALSMPAGASEDAWPNAGEFPRFDWGTGDSWEYVYTYDYQGVQQHGKYHFWIESMDSVTAVMRFDGNGTISSDQPTWKGSWRESGSRVFYTPTLGISSNQARMNITFTEPEYHHEDTFIVTNYTPTYDLYSFPIKLGEEWTTNVNAQDYYYILLDGQYYDMNGNMVGGPQRRTLSLYYKHYDYDQEVLNISGRKIDARTVHTENDARVAYLSSEVGNEARVDKYDASANHVSRMEVTNWSRSERSRATLRIYVDDWTGRPLQNANIALPNGASYLTDANGAFEIKVVMGAYTIEVSKDGFMTAETTVVVSGDASVSVQLDARGRATAFLWSVAGAVALTCIGITAVAMRRKHKIPIEKA